jgi:hypothetical protein
VLFVCDGSKTPLWSVLYTPLMGDGALVRLAVDGSVGLTYAGSDNGRLHAGPSGESWRVVFAHDDSWAFTDIEVDPSDPTIVYASLSGTSGLKRVYRLRRDGPAPSTMRAQDITSNLPDGLFVSSIGIDRMQPFRVFAGTNRGIYRGRSTDNGATWSWTSYNVGLPPAVDVKDLEVHPTTGVLRAATFGRGAFAVNTDDPIGTILEATGKIQLLRVHEQGTGYGPPSDFIDGEVVIWLESRPGRAFGFQLRHDASESDHQGMLDSVRAALRRDRPVRIEYLKTGIRNGKLLRVSVLQ